MFRWVPDYDKSMRVVFFFSLSLLVSMNGRWIVPRGHSLCLVKLAICRVAGLRLSFNLSGRRHKQGSYIIYVELLVSMYIQLIVMSLMDPWIMSRSSPRQPIGRGSFAENVKPFMDLVRLSTPSCSSCLPRFDLIIMIS